MKKQKKGLQNIEKIAMYNSKMRSVYKCLHCGHEEVVYDEDLKFSHPICLDCLVELEYDRDE